MELTDFIIFDIQDDVYRIESVIATNIFAPENSSHPLISACITEILVCLNDLLQKCKDCGGRITFTDDLILTPKVKDITDTMAMLRNAVCHITSKTHFVNTNKFTGNIIYGTGNMKLNEFIFESKYCDDVCFNFGEFSLFLVRHILRAVFEAKVSFTVLIGFSAFHQLVALQIPELTGVILSLAIPSDNMYQ